MTEPSPKGFRDVMRAFVGHCSLITAGAGDTATGLVVTSGMSLSAEPPLVLKRAPLDWIQIFTLPPEAAFAFANAFGWQSEFY